ncbi:MAG: DUF1926 domain-containing protein [Candidatus Zixiibacteriota bacterium]|nr:MAG: DUF1926 domain-containing protein [candidate division Zixibacteria bacterium]
MAKYRLAFGLHNHQPVGNFDHVFEYAHDKAYRSFLEVFEKHNLRISLHQSGILWEWQQKNHPEYLDLINRLVRQGRLELMTGGFYEPILTSIPERDAAGQIKQLSTYIEKKFDVTPEGLWLAERIWEPHLPKLLALAGVKFLPVDDTHFIYAGFEHSQLTGPFVTEHENYRVTLLPISKRLRYLIPFGTIEEVINELKSLADKDPSGMVIYADDGEKFGSWPQTHEHCYEDKWLSKFFEALEENSDWLDVITLGEAAVSDAAGRAYLPSASYAEMLHWSLPPKAFVDYEEFETYLKKHGKLEQFGRFVRGGHWRGFLAKYDEANLMHKKMLHVSEKLADAEAKHKRNKQVKVARDRLYAGQCNCPYWHGVFGGLYLPHIRQAIYQNLVEAEAIIDGLSDEGKIVCTVRDFDADGYDEMLISNRHLSALFKPSRGGNLVELSLKNYHFSVTDTLTRRKEGYHLKLDRAVAPGQANKTESIHDLVVAKEAGLKELLVEDWYLKRCFIDHLFDGEVDFDIFRSGVFREDGDFVLEPYLGRFDETAGRLDLVREGHLWRAEGVVDIKLTKQFIFHPDSSAIEVVYTVLGPSDKTADINFAIENSFNMQAGHHDSRYMLIDGKRPKDFYLDAAAAHVGAKSWAMVDKSRNLALVMSSDIPCDIWHLPIFTVSLSEGGFEKVYQGTTFVNRFSFRLNREPATVRLILRTGPVETETAGLA